MSNLNQIMADLRCFVFFGRRCRAPLPAFATKQAKIDYWHTISRRYGNTIKRLTTSGYRWRILTFKDGHKELAYLSVRKWGLAPAIFRGLVIPRMVGYIQFSNIQSIKTAF